MTILPVVAVRRATESPGWTSTMGNRAMTPAIPVNASLISFSVEPSTKIHPGEHGTENAERNFSAASEVCLNKL